MSPSSPLARDWWTLLRDPTLDRLVEQALAQSRDLRVAQARLREARALRGLAAADRGPSVTADGSVERQRRSENGGLPTGRAGAPRDFTLYDAGFDASFELDLFGRVRREVESADAELAASDAALGDATLTLAAEVAREYVDLRSAQRRRAVALLDLAAQRDGVALAQARFDAGVENELALVQARALVATSESSLPPLELAADAARHRLAVLLDAAPDALPIELADAASALPPTPPAVPVGLPSQLLERRPDVVRAERELAGATARVGVATADLYPRFALNGAVGLQSDTVGDFAKSGSTRWNFGPSFSWPVFVSGRIRQNVHVEEARAEQALAQFEHAVVVAVVDVEDALAGVARQKARREALAAEVAAEQRAVELAKTLYERGLVDFLNVLDAQRRLFDAQQQAVVAQGDELSSVIALCKALGGGWQNGRDGGA
jgi:NodT family efflux transporter outer membrane factor (OMF) lipoprotein